MDNWQSLLRRSGCGDWADWLILDSATLNKTDKKLSIVFSAADSMSDEARASIRDAFVQQFRELNVETRFLNSDQISMDSVR